MHETSLISISKSTRYYLYCAEPWAGLGVYVAYTHARQCKYVSWASLLGNPGFLDS